MINSTTPQLHRLDLPNQISEIPGAVIAVGVSAQPDHAHNTRRVRQSKWS
jgi:hypothetical protein